MEIRIGNLNVEIEEKSEMAFLRYFEFEPVMSFPNGIDL